MNTKPNAMDMYAFNVGFGDCILLQFQYKNGRNRHLLIDFGSTRQPKTRPNDFLNKIAEQIQTICDGQLDIVVATHRHKDHIYGFRTKDDGTGPGDIIASCAPKLILQPWTEHPDAAIDATSSPDQNASFARTLLDMNDFAEQVQEIANSKTSHLSFSKSVRSALSFLGENNISNKSAVKNLMTMGEKNQYLAFGDKVHSKAILPGVTIDVLGPPTLVQSQKIRKQRKRHNEEYWHLQALSARETANRLSSKKSRSLFPKHNARKVPSWARWTKNKMIDAQSEMFMPIVRQLDKQMNNTSLILLVSVGKKSFLFPGDAQWENWSYALSDANVLKKLRTVDVYKVGHHGSLNATPKSLWKEFRNKGSAAKRGRLTAIMSTMHGVHGHSEKTAVPRSSLVTELRKNSRYIDTEELAITKQTTEFFKKVSFKLN